MFPIVRFLKHGFYLSITGTVSKYIHIVRVFVWSTLLPTHVQSIPTLASFMIFS